jgi:hypothetical protein
MEIDLDKIDDTVLGLLWLYEPYGVRTAGWIRLGGCQPNRVQAKLQFYQESYLLLFYQMAQPYERANNLSLREQSRCSRGQ